MADKGFNPALAYDNAVDSAWSTVLAQHSADSSNLALSDKLPAVIIKAVVERLSAATEEVVVAVHDPKKGLVLFKMEVNEVTTTDEKPPRPANAFILFRQAMHPLVKADNPGIMTIEICKFLGLSKSRSTLT
jgi:hypothetical protein